MPELPEVETIRRGLQRELVGRRIEGVDARPAKLRGGVGSRPLTELEGTHVRAVDRHGKFLIWSLTGNGGWRQPERPEQASPKSRTDGRLLIHLGMTGKLLFADPGEAMRPHTHLVLSLDDERELRFSDPRRFGLLKLYGPTGDLPDLAHYGPDALDPDFSVERLRVLLQASSAPLKSFLLDQRKLAGVGNIYACEALWRSGLSPRRKARRTPKASVELLHKSIIDVLQDSLAAGGSSFNDYVDAIGKEGQFMADVAVFQREGEECQRCGTTIRRIVQSGRSTFYCPRCQR